MAMYENLGRTMKPYQALKIACDDCSHQVTWSYADAIDRLGPHASPSEIRARLVCSLCGGPARIWI